MMLHYVACSSKDICLPVLIFPNVSSIKYIRRVTAGSIFSFSYPHDGAYADLRKISLFGQNDSQGKIVASLKIRIEKRDLTLVCPCMSIIL